MTQSTVSRYESGMLINIKKLAVIKMAEIFGTTIDYINSGEENSIPVQSIDTNIVVVES